MQHPIESPLLTEKEAAAYLRRSISSLRRDRKSGVGPKATRLGRSVRYLKTELDRHIAAGTVGEVHDAL